MTPDMVFDVPNTKGPNGQPATVSLAATLYKLNTALDAYLADPSTGTSGGTTGGTGGTTGGSGGTAPADSNSYPLAMPSGVSNGGAVTIGTGPDTLMILASNNPGGAANAFNVIAYGGHFGSGGTSVATNLGISSSVGMNAGQTFTIRGVFRDATKLVFSPAPAFNGPWFNSVQINGMPWAANGVYDSRGSQSVNALQVFNSNGAPITWTPWQANGSGTGAGGTGTTQPAATLTQIQGATINGQAVAADTLANIVGKVPSGGTLLLPAGTIFGTAAVNVPCTISGSTTGTTVIDAAGVALTQGKAVFVPTVAGVVFQNMTIQNAACPDNNGAGIRDAGSGIGFTAKKVVFKKNQNGVLTFNGNYVLDTCTFDSNGAGDGYSHNAYFGQDGGGSATITNCTFIAGPLTTHCIKSRLQKTTVSGGSCTTSGNGACLDVPEGGAVSVTNVDWTISNGGQGNHNFFTYAMESGGNISAGAAPSLTGVRLHDQTGSGGFVQAGASNAPTAKLTLGTGCTYAGSAPPTVTGFSNVTGSFAKSS